MSRDPVIIVGSGPSGIAAAHALINRGVKVSLIDVGLELDQERTAQLEKMSKSEQENWDQDFIKQAEWHRQIKPHQMPKRLAYGSNFPYAQAEEYFESPSDSAIVYASFAKGGLSNVWGAVSLPYSEKDIADWPITLDELTPHYKTILDLVPFSAREDSLSDIYPLYTENYEEQPLSRQAQTLLSNLEKAKESLSSQGFVFGASRLMLRTRSQENDPGCVLCGMCLHGCPYGLIFNSADLVDEFQRNENFEYKSGIRVDNFSEEAGQVIVEGYDIYNNSPVIIKGSKLILACGAASSLRLVLRARKLFNKKVDIKSNQHFIIPIMSFKNTANVLEENLQSTCQAIMQIHDPKEAENNIHFQASTYSNLVQFAVQNALGPAFKLFKLPIEKFIYGRLMVLQGYLHSSKSPVIQAELSNDGNLLEVKSSPEASAKKLIKKSIGKLISNSFKLKAFPLLPLLDISKPGQGSHLGACLPMKSNPGELEVDSLGKLTAYNHVHIVDSSILPSIPPSSITLSAMANSHRIASNMELP